MEYNYNHKHARQRANSLSYSTTNPSFSSSLLDAIYRSIDDDENLVLYKDTMKKNTSTKTMTSQEERANFQRACMIEKWMEKEKLMLRRKSIAADFHRNTSSSSSDSSSGGVFSSSEAEFSSSSTCYSFQRPKPIRTTIAVPHENVKQRDYMNQKVKLEDGYKRTKSKALKIYADLKKVKQPISPGTKLASFLNSLFAAKKRSSSEHQITNQSTTSNTSACSSASSFSRSCLSKTPSSAGRINGGKRSVRFYPVSVILDEDSQPCGHKSLPQEDKKKVQHVQDSLMKNEEFMMHVMEKNRRVDEAARELLRNYQKKIEHDYDLKKDHVKNTSQEFDDDEDDDASCASSDLFELDNLSAIGMDHERYREELPVYETTHLGTIANGFML